MKAKFLNKRSYGPDQSGEVYDNTGKKELAETAEPQDHHETPVNPANVTRDVDAEEDYPEITPVSNRLPSRSAR